MSYANGLFPLNFLSSMTFPTQFSTHKVSFHSISYVQGLVLLNFLHTKTLSTQFLTYKNPFCSISCTQGFLPPNFLYTKTPSLLYFLYTTTLATQFPLHNDSYHSISCTQRLKSWKSLHASQFLRMHKEDTCYSISFTQCFLVPNFLNTKTKELTRPAKSACVPI